MMYNNTIYSKYGFKGLGDWNKCEKYEYVVRPTMQLILIYVLGAEKEF